MRSTKSETKFNHQIMIGLFRQQYFFVCSKEKEIRVFKFLLFERENLDYFCNRDEFDL